MPSRRIQCNQSVQESNVSAVEFRGFTMNGVKTVADLLSKFRLAGHFRLIVDTDADPRFSLVRVEPV